MQDTRKTDHSAPGKCTVLVMQQLNAANEAAELLVSCIECIERIKLFNER